jgi:RNA polymerase sigma-70 factor (ECF subfamily)
MSQDEWLAERFEQYRPRLGAVAYRMLGSRAEADDAVQDTWLRFSRTDTAGVENLGSWLSTVVSRVCLNMLQARQARPESPLGGQLPEPATDRAETDPEYEAVLADSVGLALVVVLDTLAPAERVAFVLHDMFGVPFEEIAPIVGRSTPATRQLASRARRRVRGQQAADGDRARGPEPGDGDRARQARLVDAFFAAARQGDFAALLAVLDPDVVVRADEAAVAMGAPAQIAGAANVVAAYAGRARGATLALVDGAAGAVWRRGGKPRVVFRFVVGDGKITGIELIGDPARLEEIDLVVDR